MNKLPLVYDGWCNTCSQKMVLKVYSDYCTFSPIVIELLVNNFFYLYYSICDVYIAFKNIKNVCGMPIIPLYICFKDRDKIVCDKYIIWLSYCDFIKKKFVYHHDFKPSFIHITDNGNVWIQKYYYEKRYMKNHEYSNNGDYDSVDFSKDRCENSIQIKRFFYSNHSFIKPYAIFKNFICEGGLNYSETEKIEKWKAYNKYNRFNGPSFQILSSKLNNEEYYFNGVKIPENIIRFKNSIPSKELNQSSVLEAMLFDRAYGKAVDMVYKTNKIASEEEIYNFVEKNNA